MRDCLVKTQHHSFYFHRVDTAQFRQKVFKQNILLSLSRFSFQCRCLSVFPADGCARLSGGGGREQVCLKWIFCILTSRHILHLATSLTLLILTYTSLSQSFEQLFFTRVYSMYNEGLVCIWNCVLAFWQFISLFLWQWKCSGTWRQCEKQCLWHNKRSRRHDINSSTKYLHQCLEWNRYDAGQPCFSSYV